jgi:hypothetical protein
MKIKFISLPVLICSLALVFNACKKDSTSSQDNTTELTSQSDDENRFSTEVDAVANDANAALSTNVGMNGGRMEGSPICDATMVVDSTSDPRTITITYNGTNCWGNRSRTGVVKLSLPANKQWKDAGAALTVTFTNLKITRVADGKSITLNGTKTITNVSGGLVPFLAGQGTITHTITSSGITVTFDNNTQRTWQIAEQRVFTYNNGIVITTTGTQTIGGNPGVAEWGTNRNGNAFTTRILTPVVIRQDCNFRVVSGSIEHSVPNAIATVTFGLDKTGNPTSCPTGTDTYFFKLEWTVLNTSHSVILPY